MKQVGRVLVIGGLLGLTKLLAQQPSSAELDAVVKRNAELHTRALQIVEAERARAQRLLCPNANTTIEINTCYSQELGTADGNEVKLVRAIGALMRAGTEKPGVPPKRLDFDEAETTWHLYRDQECKAAGELYEGGTIRPSIEMGCKITVAHQHMEELWAVYKEVGIQ